MTVEDVYRGRRAAAIENDHLRVTVLVEGGHIAGVLDKASGVNPLWTPPWTSIEPSRFDPIGHRPIYGDGADARLLAGIMGHNLCLDIFGGPSSDEAVAGLTAHGDAPVVPYEISRVDDGLVMRTQLPLALIAFERRIALRDRSVAIRERVESLCGFDRPIGWTEHVTLGPPFLEKGATQFRASARRSLVYESAFGAADYLRPTACFDWPDAPALSGGVADLRMLTNASKSSAYTAHLMDDSAETAFFVAYSPAARLAFGYVWKRSDFPWMGIWEENHSRAAPPWNGETLARGMEFGVSPFPESRRAMVDRRRLFETPTYRWLPARGCIEAAYWIILRSADRVPEHLAPPAHTEPS